MTDQQSRTPAKAVGVQRICSRREYLARVVGCGSITVMLTACGVNRAAHVMPAMSGSGITTPGAAMPVMAAMPIAPGSTGTAVTAATAVVAADGSIRVGIDNFAFAPKTLTVVSGAKVVWTNHDDVPHTVTSRTKQFASIALDTDEQFAYQFTAPGTYEYFCAIHPVMTARIIVQ